MDKPDIILRFTTDQAFFPSKMQSFITVGEFLSSKFIDVSINIDVIPNGIIVYILTLKDLEKVVKFTEKVFNVIKSNIKNKKSSQIWHLTCELNYTNLTDKEILNKYHFVTDENYDFKIMKGKESGKYIVRMTSYPYQIWFKTIVNQYKIFRSNN